MQSGLDHLLFNLLILRGLCDSRGCIWKCKPQDLYVVEVTDVALQRRLNEVNHDCPCANLILTLYFTEFVTGCTKKHLRCFRRHRKRTTSYTRLVFVCVYTGVLLFCHFAITTCVQHLQQRIWYVANCVPAIVVKLRCPMLHFTCLIVSISAKSILKIPRKCK